MDSANQNDIAIIGMSCIFPGAADLQAYWENIIAKVDAVSDPPDGWGSEEIYDPESTANDRIYCKRGGYLGDASKFNPLDYGIMPQTVDGGEPEHFLALRVAHDALADAGYLNRPFNREKTAVILGRSTFLNRGNTTAFQHGQIVDQTLQVLKRLHPDYTETDLQEIKQELKASLPPFNVETAPALVANIMCGRIANRLDLQGPNYMVDAACASSLIAVDHGMQELISGRCDLALVGGVSISTSPVVFMVFSQLGALSRKNQIKPFDKNADGTLLGEGLGIVVLKRLQQAERDGDRIYACLKAVGVASDGRELAVLAPRVEGEALALQRAYESAGLSPKTVGLIEAHGTGTIAGDIAEIQALTKVFGDREGRNPHCAIGSVKSMISHTIPAAGIAGLIKTALALHHRILPPTLHCEEPNPDFELEKTPFYINSESRPWIQGAPEPRRAGVNAFGFGGINTHAILEEYAKDSIKPRQSFLHTWDSEVLILQGKTRQALIDEGSRLQTLLKDGAKPALKDLAYTLNRGLEDSEYRLAIVAKSLADLQKKLSHAMQRLADPECRRIKDRSGIFFFENPLSRAGSLAFVFPGEGSQYTNMLSDLCLHFPEVRRCFDQTDKIFYDNKREILPSQVLFPPPLNSSNVDEQPGEKLWQMDCAISSVFTANLALFRLLSRLGISPGAMAGHSSGEYAALLASGIIKLQDEQHLIQHSLELNSIYNSLAEEVPEARLMAVGAADPELVTAFLATNNGSFHVSMDNCPHQMILCGPEGMMLEARDHLQSEGAICSFLPFERAYHTPLFQPVCDKLAHFFKQVDFGLPNTTVYSCVTAQPYPEDPETVRQLAVDQWARPVRFRETIEAMYDAGTRIFVEVGPKKNLTGFIDDILKKRDYVAMPANVSFHSGITQLNHLIGLLAAHGVAMHLDYLYERRAPQRLKLQADAGSFLKSKDAPGTMKLALELPRLELRQTNGFPKKQKKPSTTDAPTRSSSNARALSETTRPVQPSPAVRGNPRAQVMEEYFQTMEHFLDVQQTLLTEFSRKRQGVSGAQRNGSEAPTTNNPSASVKNPGENPFNINVSSLSPGEELKATCQLDLKEHVFLHDHTIGGRLSNSNAKLIALPVNPLAVSLEIMAQTASLLAPEKPLVAMRNVKAQQWIVVSEPLRTLWVTAKRQHSEAGVEVGVEIFQTVESKDAADETSQLVVEGTMVFDNRDEQFVNPSMSAADPLKSERPYRFTPEEYYRKEVTYHGPSFQTVIHIERCGDDGLDALLQVPPKSLFFRSGKRSGLLTDPALLDTCGQSIGFWASDRLETGFATFPLGFEALEICGPWPQESEHLKCHMRITRLTDARVRSNLEFVDSQGRLLVRVTGWQDSRFDFPRPFSRFVLSPCDRKLSRSWPEAIAHLPASRFQCCFLDSLPSAVIHGHLWPRAFAQLILTPTEHDVWANLKGVVKRRKEWMMGRVAAKDAVRVLLKNKTNLDLSPAEIEISTDKYGRPIISPGFGEKINCQLIVSITHSRGRAMAIAGEKDSDHGIGIDMEYLDRNLDGIKKGALSPQEQTLLSSVGDSFQDEWMLRMWCAKEATAKALGRGMAGSPFNLVIKAIEPETGTVKMTVAGELAKTFSDLRDKLLTVYTYRDNELVVATSLV